MKTYILTDKTWHRGQGSAYSYIIPPTGEGPRCCLGNLVQQEGWDGKFDSGAVELTGGVEKLVFKAHEWAGTRSSPVYEIYEMNDNDEVEWTDQERVEQINKLTEPFGFQFEFRQDA